MIVKFFSHGTGGGKDPVRYLTEEYNKEEKKWEPREDAIVLRGNTLQIEQQIDSIDNKNKYTSGVLSFAEQITPEQKEQIIDGFEDTLFPGMDKTRYSSLWVEHREHDRTELHFIIPRKDLWTEKGLQPYFAGADKKRVNAWKDMTNAEHNFADPNDPNRQRGLILSRDLPKERKKAVQSINKGVKALIAEGEIKDRTSLVSALNEHGFEVVREVKSSISIKDPEGGKNIRLKGIFYERDFEFGKFDEEEIRGSSEQYHAERKDRFAEARGIYRTGIDLKRAELDKRYPETKPNRNREPEQAHQSHEPMVFDPDLVLNRDSRGELDVDGMDREQNLKESEGLRKQREDDRKLTNNKEQRGELDRVGEEHGGLQDRELQGNGKITDNDKEKITDGRADNQATASLRAITERSSRATKDIQDYGRSAVNQSGNHADRARKTSDTVLEAVKRASNAIKRTYENVKTIAIEKAQQIKQRYAQSHDHGMGR
ncbi:MAG: relaxase/mobilization nuclease domain-containing protein [Candidatus Pacearchaeota archaeon]|nr:relaxase/mobilization nuclease domain-containing protein [Candidatus Pacearchaeota archaeon]